jgi:hypothetical protein
MPKVCANVSVQFYLFNYKTMKRIFDLEHRPHSDACAIEARDAQNKSLNEYRLFNPYSTSSTKCDDAESKIKEFTTVNHTTYKDGYGNANACRIDADTTMRLGAQITNERYKVPLNTRLFTAVPNLSRGGLAPEVESRLTQGQDTQVKKSCDNLGGIQIDRFVPLLPCLKDTIQNPETIVPKWTWGGEPTRDSMRQRQFLEANGYQFDGKVWAKKLCGDGARLQ